VSILVSNAWGQFSAAPQLSWCFPDTRAVQGRPAESPRDRRRDRSTPATTLGPGNRIASRDRRRRCSDFAGYTSETLNTPFVNAASPDDPVAAFFYRRPLGEKLKLSSYNLVCGRLTSVQSLEWTPIQDLSFAASAGVGYQQPYGASALGCTETR
jgi:hypothetical protein